MSDYILCHHGIKGQKWGVRRFQNKDGSLTPAGKKRVQRQASKDAKEFARAKMYYGEGAGTRRKLINATVNERSKNPDYKKAFDEEFSKQDMSKHASKAKKERRKNDTVKSAKNTGRGVVNIITGHPERLGAGMFTAYAAYNVAHRYGVDKTVAKMAKTTASKVYNDVKTQYGRMVVERTFRKMGM